MLFAPLTIGNLKLTGNVLMAPMVGLSTRPYRILALRHGSALSASEMVSSEFLVRATREERRSLRVRPEERPAALQLVGARVEAMAEAAAIAEDLGADVVDVNMGCPARRITRGGGGAALLADLAMAGRIVEAMAQRVSVPVTVKIRAGLDSNDLNGAQAARVAEDAGASLVTVHARTKEQRHSGAARLDVIAAVKAEVRVPVVGNGGVRTPEDAEQMLRVSGCDAVMIGRAAVGNLFLFEETVRWLRDREASPPPSPSARLRDFEEHLALLMAEFGVPGGVIAFRKCLPHYLKGIPGAREARGCLAVCPDPDEILETARRIYRGAVPERAGGFPGAATFPSPLTAGTVAGGASSPRERT